MPVPLGPDVPDAVRDVFDHFHDLHIPDDVPPAVRDIYKIGSSGKCMTCHRPVGESAVVTVNILGPIQLYCSLVCSTDMIIRGYLEELYDDLAQRVQFRGDAER